MSREKHGKGRIGTGGGGFRREIEGAKDVEPGSFSFCTIPCFSALPGRIRHFPSPVKHRLACSRLGLNSIRSQEGCDHVTTTRG